jgi:RNA 2',3'-cyclic 3'-phosphodiesterase
MLRAFIAIQLSDQLKSQIGDLQANLKRRAPEVRGVGWARPESIHLTLRFLGDIEETQVEPLKRVLEAAAAEARPFSLEARGLGAFPTPQRARVIWLGLHGLSGGVSGKESAAPHAESTRDARDERRPDDALTALVALQAAIEEGVVGLGLAREDRPFMPHLTLARIRERKAMEPLIRLLTSHRDHLVGSMRADAIALVRSELRPEGAVYTSLVEVPLGMEYNPASSGRRT